ncbi:MAG: hypothetical protein K2O75_01900 [Lactobacillus sp.]|uniref:hypothetical protein n=1 Tax=Lactobacillus sp. TaxID=1591 RepID=UPI0023D0018C|nr:hypothetical protein [Lactobacillus sp.]MDE7049614.1 hypothetical protein [Lactobacillus sp.]
MKKINWEDFWFYFILISTITVAVMLTIALFGLLWITPGGKGAIAAIVGIIIVIALISFVIAIIHQNFFM